MKKFFDGGQFFVLSAFCVVKAPLEVSDLTKTSVAQTLCEDAYYLSEDGGGQTAIEFIRVAENKRGSAIQHIIVIRTHASNEKDCVIRQEAIIHGMYATLHQNGYEVRELTFEEYQKVHKHVCNNTAWGLNKVEIIDYGVHNSYKSFQVLKEVDWKNIYAALDGSGCSLAVQVIPTDFSETERKLIIKNHAICAQAEDGVSMGFRDTTARLARERWEYYANRLTRPVANVNVIIYGDTVNAALTVARIRQSVGSVLLQNVDLNNIISQIALYNFPWGISAYIQKISSSMKFSIEEAALMMNFPRHSDYFIGIEENSFSLAPETSLLPNLMTQPLKESICIGKTIYSDQFIYLTYKQLLLHSAVMGKSGTGKTTFLKQLICQIHAAGIPILIFEPVKREYRDMVMGLKKSKIFTVEKPVVPLRINPFSIPKGVTFAEYRSCLLSAFKAAFSLPDPLPAIFEKAIEEVYLQFGWTDMSRSTDKNVRLFDMNDFIRVFKRVIVSSDYSNEVKGNMMSGGAFRLQSLVERCPRTFDNLISTDVEDLLSGCNVIEMGSLEAEQKSLVTALTLIRILSYLKANRNSDGKLCNVILIDEAHALLDQGEGVTQEEKALNNAMSQLLVNIVTEMRAYGVGVIFADQSPSRIGSCLLDNVENLISFRLSGDEATLQTTYMGAGNNITECLPLISTGEYLLKNQHLREPLAIRMNYVDKQLDNRHYSDEQVALLQKEYLILHANDYRPYAACAKAECDFCSASIRSEAHKFAVQIYNERKDKLNSMDTVAAHIMKIPVVMNKRLGDMEQRDKDKIFKCIAIHILRICAIEKGISIAENATERLLNFMIRGVNDE